MKRTILIASIIFSNYISAMDFVTAQMFMTKKIKAANAVLNDFRRKRDSHAVNTDNYKLANDILYKAHADCIKFYFEEYNLIKKQYGDEVIKKTFEEWKISDLSGIPSLIQMSGLLNKNVPLKNILISPYIITVKLLPDEIPTIFDHECFYACVIASTNDKKRSANTD